VVSQPKKNIGLIGVAVFIVAESMFFVGLFSAWFFLRATSGDWPPPGIERPSPAPAVFNTLVALMSAAAMIYAERGSARDDQHRLVAGISVAAVFGLIFMAVQAAEFADLVRLAQGSSYGSTFAFLLVFHVARVFVGVGLMVIVLIRALLGQFSPQRRLMVQATALYWYFITGVWLVVFVTLYPGW
jgi:heme/copper-type cytochrome/quinol oxidase subunit 3